MSKPYYFVFLFLALSILGLDFAKPMPAQACKTAARVLNLKHPNYNYGDSLCFDTPLRLTPKVGLMIVCLNDPRTLVLSKSSDLNRCPRSRYGISPRFPERPYGVTRLGQSINPILEYPLGSTFKGSQLKLRWPPVPQATGYRVTIDNGEGLLRNFTTRQNEHIVTNLQPGSYLLTVRAFTPEFIGQTTATVKVLTDSQKNKINTLLQAIENLQIPNPDRLAMKLGVLLQYNLLQDSIEIANQYLSFERTNPVYFKILGDLYVAASKPESAISYYKKYHEIAQKIKSQEEIADAKRRLEYVAAYSKS
jgi:hypothetical protein